MSANDGTSTPRTRASRVGGNDHGADVPEHLAVMTSKVLLGSAVLAGIVGAAVFLRPRPAGREELARPDAFSPALLGVLKTKMGRHDTQMRALMSRVVLLDDDGVARAAGELFDEPSLARPLAGDELRSLLPERFFALQDEIRLQARRLVIASNRHDRTAVANEFAAMSKTCITCHEVYLRGAEITPYAGSAP